jgi:hypothetical protein
MTYRFIYLIYFYSVFGFSQNQFTLSGSIYESEGQETLIGANIIFPKVNTGAITNEYGFYSITLPKGTYDVKVSYLGYSSISKTIILNKNLTQNFSLEANTDTLDEIVLKTDAERVNIKTAQMSVNSLNSNTIKQIPVVFGEADLVKAITLLPGISSGGEGTPGFNVRGGSNDQNLILLDEATLFNSSHLFGFFSVFNPDAIKNLKLYKGGIPAKYGGRVASVLDIYQKEGNKNEFRANGGIGLVSSRVLFEGPLKKEKGSFLFGGRSTYAHLFLPLFDIDNIAYFYDINTKLSYRLDLDNKIYLSGYFGRDVFNVSNSFENTYGNTVVNFRWNHLFSDKLFSNLSLIYSDYYYGLDLNFVGFKWNSGIQNMNVKFDLKQYLNDHFSLEYGLQSTYYGFNPGIIQPNGPTSGINREELTKKNAFENAVYLDIKQQVSEKISLRYGARLSSFLRLGQDELNSYDDDNPLIFNPELQIYQAVDPIGTINRSSGSVEASFINIEPRLSLSYLFNENSSVKASYNRMAQYLHLLSNTTAPTPLDVWAPSGKYIKPQLLDQIALGYFKNYNDYSFEIEAYYKKTKNRIDYIDGANLIANKAIEQVILNGRSRAYGLEVLLRKNEGRLKGWLAYTLSKSEQQTEGRNPSETGINNGNWYNTPFDKTHDISVTSSYDLNKKWTLNANFLYQTGQPTTYPNGQYVYNGLFIPTYEARNSSRLPSYHRFDLSAKYIPKPNKTKAWRGEWVFSIYNIYNRKNAQSLNFRQNTDTGQNEALKLSIFGAIGSITYNFKF